MRTLLGGATDLTNDFNVLFREDVSSYNYYYSMFHGLAIGNAPSVRGHIDEIIGLRIAGWAFNEDFSDHPLMLNVFLNNKYLKTVSCSGYREDVEKVHKIKFCAFEIVVPENQNTSQNNVLSFKDLFDNRVGLMHKERISYEFDLMS